MPSTEPHGQTGQRGSAPEGERLPEEGGRPGVVALLQGELGGGAQPVMGVRVDGLVAGQQGVTTGAGDEQFPGPGGGADRAGEVVAQLEDVRLDRHVCLRGRVGAPELFHHRVHRHDLAGVHGEQCEELAGFVRGGGEPYTVHVRGERPQHGDLHRLLLPGGVRAPHGPDPSGRPSHGRRAR